MLHSYAVSIHLADSLIEARQVKPQQVARSSVEMRWKLCLVCRWDSFQCTHVIRWQINMVLPPKILPRPFGAMGPGFLSKCVTMDYQARG